MDPIYRRLQHHLDRQAVGFPKVKSGADVDLLSDLFTPIQAAVALGLSYQFVTVETIFQRKQKIPTEIQSPAELTQILESMVSAGLIFFRDRKGMREYALVPLVVGIYEMQLPNLTPTRIKKIDAYLHSLNFELTLIGTKYSQMRTIPIEQAISPTHPIQNYNDIRALLQDSAGPFVICKCICREKRAYYGEPCRKTKRTELCLAIGDFAQLTIHNHVGRQISREEAMEIIRQDEAEGLVLQTSGAREPDFICACCSCCCGMLRALKKVPRAAEFWTSYFRAEIDVDVCKTCGLCVNACPMQAIQLGDRITIKASKCLGCGVCVAKCPAKALRLEPKAMAPIPATYDAFYEELKQAKKGTLGHLIMAIQLKRGKKWHHHPI